MSLVNHISKAEQDMCLPFYVVREFEIIQKKKNNLVDNNGSSCLLMRLDLIFCLHIYLV